ncbi:MAG TPA: hypothetical protein VHZ73_02380, partial [Vicinamibacterales bacterium]|nr:hypothetical protein [Vicinamibacterales bacterium]
KATAAEKKRQEQESQGLLETTKLWDDYSALVLQHSGTTTAAQIANIDKWAADLTAKVQKAGADTEGFYDALYAVIDEKQQSVLVNWQAISASSAQVWKQNLQDTADKAAATYQYMIDHADLFRIDTIAKFQDIAFQAENAADDWATSWNASLDTVDQHLDVTAQKQNDVAAAAKAAAQAVVGINTVGPDPSTTNPLSSLPLMVQYALAGVPVNGNSTIGLPTRDSGGPVSAGMPYAIGKGAQPELFVPSSNGSMFPAGSYGGTSIVFNTGPVYDGKGFQAMVRKTLEDALRSAGVRI